MRSVAGLAQTVPPRALHDRLDLRQEARADEIGDLAQPLAVELERGMHVETRLSAGAGRAVGAQRRMAVGDEHDAREIAADHRFQRRAQLREIARQVARRARCRRPRPTGSRCGRTARARVVASMITLATSPEKSMSFAPTVSSTRSSVRSGRARRAAGEILLQLRDLRRHRARAAPVRRAVELARALRAEHAVLDRRAGAGERQERHRDVRVLDRERERGAELVAVERAVAGLAQPARAEPRPFGEFVRRAALGARRCGRR